ncbi:MAG: ABC transporter ATP-binding protein [Lachnospiraceae bacterium]|nr:ABC transporter ATP-binding protein [Lachnospiraceae bacterium]
MSSRIGYRYKIVKCLLGYAAGVKRYWITLFIVSAVMLGLELAAPILYKILINEVILRGELYKLTTVIIGYLLIYFSNVLANNIMLYVRYTLYNTVLLRIRQKILTTFFERPFSEYEKLSIGELKMNIDDDTEQIKDFANVQTVDYLIAFIKVLGCIAILFFINKVIALLAFITIPLTFIMDRVLSAREKKVQDAMRDNRQQMLSWLHESVTGWKEIKALNLAKYEQRRYYQYLHKDMHAFANWINYWTTRVLVVPKIKNEFFLQFGLYLVGGVLIVNRKLTIGDLLVFAVYYSLLFSAVQTVSKADADLHTKRPYIDRLLFNLQIAENVPKQGIIPDESNSIALSNVSFSYPDTDKLILKDFNLSINKGERIAIVGKSGSGKTTLLKLITGMLDPTSGKVMFSGIDLKNIDMQVMHERIGFVMQENILFNTSIRENLFYGKNNACENELIEACKSAGIWKFIISLPEGLNTIIGEKGVKLSGGQRQRIVLARLFLQDVAVYILDEATSALDQFSENIVQDAINNIAKDKTIIVVAHRKSSIKLCDRVVHIPEIN